MILSSLNPHLAIRMLDTHRDGRGHRSKHLSQPQHHDDGEEDEDMMDMSPISNRILKTGKGKKKNAQVRFELNMCEEELHTHKEELDTCNAELAAYIAKDNSPEYLYGQQADKCKIIRKENGRMFMESSMFLDYTEEFSDRPFQYENTILTSSWFSSRFNNIFEDSKDGWPNAAISLVDNDESKGIVVSAFVNGYVINQDDTAIYGYELDQSEDQASVMSLEELLGDEDERIFDHCSFFIDSVDNTGCPNASCNGDGCCPGCKDGNDPFFLITIKIITPNGWGARSTLKQLLLKFVSKMVINTVGQKRYTASTIKRMNPARLMGLILKIFGAILTVLLMQTMLVGSYKLLEMPHVVQTLLIGMLGTLMELVKTYIWNRRNIFTMWTFIRDEYCMLEEKWQRHEKLSRYQINDNNIFDCC